MKKPLNRITVIILIVLMTLFFAGNAQALIISNINVENIRANSAKITWDTDEVANGKVRFGLSSNLGFTVRHETFIFEHSLQLQGLDSETTYLFEIESSNINNDLVIDNNNNDFHSFTTQDITAPQKVSGFNVVSTTKNSISVEWQPSQASDLDHYNIYRNRIKITETAETTFTDTELSPGSRFSYKVSAVDSSGNEGTQADTLIVSTEPLDFSDPIISNIGLTDINDVSITITWITNEDSTSVIFFGTDQNFGNKEEITALVKNHSVTLKNLVKGTTVNFIVSSCDSDDNCVSSSPSSFEAGFDIKPPAINVTIPRFINRQQIDIVGTTEPFSSVKLFVNELNFPIRALDKTETPTGNFEFLNIVLQKENVIKLSVTDNAGNVNETTFRVSVDTEDPIVILDDIPRITSEKNVTIVGTVDEQVFINFFLKLGTAPKPKKVEGLVATTINNSIALEWNETKDDDFSHYVVYRKDIGPIAITNPNSYNIFTDLLVNKNREYTYFITSINKFGKESDFSDQVTVQLTEGITGIPDPEPIDTIFVKKPDSSINTSGSFSESLKLGKDGDYILTIEILDRAKNRIIIEKKVKLDTKKPTIKITSPPSGQLIFENIANEVDIRGETEPNARVHLFVDRSPIKKADGSFDFSGLPNKIENIPDSNLDASCSLNLGGNNFCSEAADFSTTADSEGKFVFENVDLTSIVSGAFGVTQVSGTELRDNRRFDDDKTTKLLFIATDQAGLRNTKEHKIRIGTCFSGNQTWDVIPLFDFQSPALLSPQRLADNRETLFFFFNYSYIGRGTDGKIDRVSMQRACDGVELLGDKRFNLSCQLMPAGAFGLAVNDEGTVTYSQLKLSRIEGMDRFLQNDWEDFFDSVTNELTFPLKLKITYRHIVNGKEIREVQSTCQELTYVLDNSVIDFREVLPDWLLFDTVDFLKDSIEFFNEVNVQIGKAVDIATVGCVSSFGVRLVVQIYRRFISFGEEKLFQIKKTVDFANLNILSFDVVGEEDQEYCNRIADNIIKRGNIRDNDNEIQNNKLLSAFKGLKLSKFSDSDLRRCFPSVASAWETEAYMYKLFRLTCDRVFGHESPSGWTENLDDEKIFQKIQEGEQCSVDQSVRGEPLRAVKCSTLTDQFETAGTLALGKDCFVIRENNRVNLYELGENINGRIYQLNLRQGPSSNKFKYALKQTELSYLTNQPQTCEQLCGVGTGSDVEIIKTSFGQVSIKGENEKIASTCTTASQCNAWNTEDKGQKFIIGGKQLVIESAKKRGYTEGCFFNNDDLGLASISDESTSRMECCCLNTAGKLAPSFYYVFDDLNRYENPEGEKGKAFEAKDSEGSPNEFKEMEWSYRYWKEGYVTLCNPNNPDYQNPDYQNACPRGLTQRTQFNPNRYISGRDQVACFGQNSWLYDPFTVPEGETGTLVMMDSRQQLSSAIQCANLAGIQNRITMLNNIQNALATCLIDIRESGTSDSAACRELFDRFVCSQVWEFINLFTNSCSPFSVGVNIDEDYGSIFGAGVNLVKSTSQSIIDSQSELASEYGNVELNNLLGTGFGEVARKVCLGAFGYDWDFSIQDVLDAAYSQSFETFVQKTTGTREFLTIDPLTGRATYDYRASWIINPGCDLESYTVDLVCVNQDELDREGEFIDPLNSRGIRCDAVGSPDGNNCDCLRSDVDDNRRKQRFFSSSGKISQNQFIQEAQDDIISSNFRYDHLKFTIRTDRRLRGADRNVCFPPGHEDGVFYFPLSDKTARDIIGCQLEPLSGVFECGASLEFFTKKGLANIVEIKLNGEVVKESETTTIFKGKPLTITPTVFKNIKSPNKCLVTELKKPGLDALPQVYLIDRDGEIQYPTVPLDSDVQPSRDIRSLESPRVNSCEPTGDVCSSVNKRMTISRIARNNDFDVNIVMKFIDQNDNGLIDLTESSQDIMMVNGIRNILGTGGWWDDTQRGPVVDERGVKFKITQVPFASGLVSIIYSMDVPTPTSDRVGETWTLNIRLFEIDEKTGSCSTFNEGELVTFNGIKQEKNFRLKLQSAGEVVNAPKISLNFKTDDTTRIVKRFLNPIESDKVRLDVKITDETGVDEKLDYEIKKPGQSITPTKTVKCDLLSSSGTGETRICSLEFDLESLGVINIGGTYELEFMAKDTDLVPHFTDAKTSIEVRCGPRGNTVGLCRTQCGRNDIIENSFIKCQDGFVCCPIEQLPP